jgi:uncharacterized delta-60 repeat protein
MRSPRLAVAVLSVIVLWAVAVRLSGPAWAAAGDLDPTFGAGGKVTTDFGDQDDVAFGVAVKVDGAIVAAGRAFQGFHRSHYDFALAQYQPDGTLDPTFGSGGKVTTDFFGGDDWANAVAIQGDGKIVAAGLAGCDFALARYTPDGSLDPTFGTGGKVTTDFGYCTQAYAVAIQSDGEIVAAGYAPTGTAIDFALARYNPDGSLDSSFGTGGKVITEFGDYAVAYAVAIQTDGHIVAAGGNSSDFTLARYNPDGSLDPAFGAGGKVTTDFGSYDQAYGVAIQTDGRIVAAGSTNVNADFALARYSPDGTLDSSFGTGGKVITDLGGDNDQANAVAILGDGKIVAAGFGLARYNPDGSLDPTFGTGGTVTTAIGAFDMAIQADGKIVTAGWVANGSNNDFAVARYLGAGPVMTSMTPTAVGQGATVIVSITGANFEPGAAVSVSGSGVTVVSTTFVNATGLKAQITVVPDAAVGPRDVTVTDAGGSVTCAGCLLVDPAPQPTSTSPDTGAQGTTERVAIFGSDFQPGAQVRIGKGITVTAARFLSSGELKASITIAAGASAGSRTVGVVNPDGGKGDCIACFGVT